MSEDGALLNSYTYPSFFVCLIIILVYVRCHNDYLIRFSIFFA